MPKGKLRLDLVTVSAAMSFAQHISLIDQLGEDLVGAALRNAYRSGDVTQADARIMGDAQQDVRVIGQKIPLAMAGIRRQLGLFARIYIHEIMVQCSD
jgi:hypothetical protein